MSQLYGRGREESYAAPRYGSGQSVYLVAKASQPVETNQATKKPVFINYYPSGGTAGPRRYMARVERVSREVVGYPGSAMELFNNMSNWRGVYDPFRSRDVPPTAKQDAGKLLSIDLDQLHGNQVICEDQLHGNQVICEDGVYRSIQPSDHYGNSTIKDGWSMQPNSVDENNPRMVAELFKKVSNWRGVNGPNNGKSSDTHDSWSNNPGGRYGYNDQREDFKGSSGSNKPPTAKHGYDRITGYADSTNYGSNQTGGYEGHGKLGDSYTGRNNNPQAAQSGRSYNDQGENYSGSGGWKGRPSTPQAYDQTISHGGDTRKKPSSMNGNYGNSDDMVSGNHGWLDDSHTRRNDNPQAPQAVSGYAGHTENLNGSSGRNKSPSKKQGYDHPTSYGGDNHRKPSNMNGNRSNSEDRGYGNRGNSDDSYTGWNNNPHAPRAGSIYTGQTENIDGSSGQNKLLSTQQVYDQPIGYGGDTHRKPSSMNGNHSNSEDRNYGNHDRLDDSYTTRNNDPQTPRAKSGYTVPTENLNGSSGRNKPLSTQQGYDQPKSYGGNTHKNPSSMNGNYRSNEGKGYGNHGKLDDSYGGIKNNPQAPRGTYDYNKTSLDYDGGSDGSNQGYGYGDGVNTRRKPSSMSNTNKQDKPKYEVHGTGYNSSSRPSTDAVITSTDAATKYNGIFVPRSRQVNLKHQPHSVNEKHITL